MCYQITEHYSACGCVYYIHAVNRCLLFGRPGHEILKSTILVGYACSSHASSHFAGGNAGIGADDTSDDEDRASAMSNINALINLKFPDATTQEATDRLSQEFLNEFSLRHLWPQIVRVSQKKGQATKNIARYLSRFSRDLRANASARPNKDQATENIERHIPRSHRALQADALTHLKEDAAGLVRRARLNIADRIVECHINELTHVGDWTSVTTAKEAPLDGIIQDEETEDLDTDEKGITDENIHHSEAVCFK
ncbi:hypothetical protein ACHAP5_007192 [Fusarium lateritium]